MSELAHTFHQRFRIDALDRLLRSGVDIEHQHAIGLMKGARKLIEQMERSRIPVRLKQHVYLSMTAGFRGGEGSPNFSWMVPVVVDYSHARGDTHHFEAPRDSGEVSQSLADHIDLHAKLERYRYCGSRVQHVVLAGNVQMK